ncbi:hypothetical protein Avbf_01182 [Armadillidium vulgare]|nr:hypothetical protein Avbf_01182 [Armadillidium vulgare]
MQLTKRDKRIWTCGRKIHIVCDINGDKKISLQEFLNCVSLRKHNNTVNESFEKKPAPSEKNRQGKNPFIEVITSA